MSDKVGSKDSWVLGILLGVFLLTFLFAAPNIFGTEDSDVLAYIGSVGGSALGGIMTAFAGWLAWATSQKQIRSQEEQLSLMQRQLDLANDEHRKRVFRFYGDALSALTDVLIKIRGEEARAEAVWKSFPRHLVPNPFLGVVGPTLPRLVGVFEHEDAWRAEHWAAQDLRMVDGCIDALNLLGNPQKGETAAQLALRRYEAVKAVREECEKVRTRLAAERNSLRDSSPTHRATHPAAPPAP